MTWKTTSNAEPIVFGDPIFRGLIAAQTLWLSTRDEAALRVLSQLV